jgi:hypothetical protein
MAAIPVSVFCDANLLARRVTNRRFLQQSLDNLDPDALVAKAGAARGGLRAVILSAQQFRQLGEVRHHAAGLVNSGRASMIIGARRRGGIADAPNFWLALPW